jgi:2-dehydropantoate 2-reductase
MRVLIYGGGSVGLGVASCLLKSGGAALSILARPDTVTALKAAGLMRSGIFGDHRADGGTFDAVASASELAGKEFDWVLVCVKSYDTLSAAEELAAARLVGPTTRIALLQNGYGNYETFAALFAPERVFVGRVITGFRRMAPNHVDITVHAAPVHVGSPEPGRSIEAVDLCALVKRGGLPCEVSQTIVADLWAKILYNVLLNALGAVFGVPYGVLGESAHSRMLMAKLADEAFDVMAAEGHRTHWASASVFLEAFYRDQLPPTAAHESSMLQDLRNGRPTEVDALNGAIVTLGRQHGVPTPVNEMVTEMIKFLEDRNRG